MVSRSAWLVAPLLIAIPFLSCGRAPVSVAPVPAASTSVPAFDHIFVVIMENTSASSIIGNTSQAPYINSLARQYAYSSGYYAITHPSLPNYLTLTGGSTFGITSDCAPSSCPVNAANLTDRIEAAGRSWKGYMESMPSACRTTDSSPYAVKHNPFVYFNDVRTNATRCASHVVPLTQLATDLGSASTTPSFAWITPNMCNDMHDCSIATGDTWLSRQIPAILNSPAFTQQSSVLFLTWDEDDSAGNNRVDFVAAGDQVKTGYVSTSTYNHYSLLRTVESAWGLATLTANDAGASAMSDLFGASATASRCSGANLSANPAPAPPDSTVGLSASAMACTNPQYEFWLQRSGSWQLARGWGGNAYTWDNSGLAPGAYQVGVWARSSGSSSSYDTYGITTSTIALDRCISAGLTSNLAAPQALGATIAFTASSTGCSSPSYEFWLQAPGGAWAVKQAYGASTGWTWATSGLRAGNYQVGVWARQAGSSSSYDAFYIRTFWLAPSAGCLVSGVSTSVAPPLAVGTSVTFAPVQTGCSKQYKFWLLRPSGPWRVMQGYGVGASWAWNTAGFAPGTYEVGVWEGSSSSPNAYESYAITSFALGVATCTSASMSASVASPEVVGAPITFSGGSTRCGAPLYEFWLLAPGGGWILKRSYTDAVWAWDTTALAAGIYQIGVWARQLGSTAQYDSYFIETYQITS